MMILCLILTSSMMIFISANNKQKLQPIGFENFLTEGTELILSYIRKDYEVAKKTLQNYYSRICKSRKGWKSQPYLIPFRYTDYRLT